MAGQDKLNAAAQKATAGFFSGKQVEDSAVTESGTNIEAKAEIQVEAAPSPKKKRTVKKGFSFRGNPDAVLRWQNYGMAVKNTHAPSEKFCVDEIWCAAIEEYIDKHPLSGKAKELYDEYTKA